MGSNLAGGCARPRPVRRWAGRLTAALAAAVLGLGGGSVASALDATEDDLGARALKGETWSTPVLEPEDLTRSGPVHPMTPPMDELYRDPSYYGDGCHVEGSGTTVVPGCRYGATDSDVTVAVVGSSKVGQFFPALEEIALREGWSLRMYTKRACAFVKDAPPTPGYPECDLYNEALREHLQANPPDLVLTSGMRTDVAEGYVSAWSFLESLGVEQIVALWDTPAPAGDPDGCVAEALQTGEDLRECAMELPDGTSGNPSLRQAAAQVGSATFVNLRGWVCPTSELTPGCPAVLGRAQVYASGSHMSQGYAPTLTDPLHQRLFEAGIATYRPSVDRVAGADRYETAALLSRQVAPGGRVFVVSGSDYPAAVAAAAKAGHTDGALLLTRADNLPPATRAALVRLAPSQIVVAGGPRSVSEDVLVELRSLAPDVQRVAGADRYATAAAVSQLEPARPGGTVYVATGAGFADALAAAAQAGQREAPILLVRSDSVPAPTAQALQALRPQSIVVVGGVGAVSDGVAADLGEYAGDGGVERRGGADRYETAALLAQDTPQGSVLHVGVGSAFADSLAAAPASAAAQGAVLLVSTDRVHAPTAESIRRLTPSSIVLTGGPTAVSDETRRELIRLVSAPPAPALQLPALVVAGRTLR